MPPILLGKLEQMINILHNLYQHLGNVGLSEKSYPNGYPLKDKVKLQFITLIDLLKAFIKY